MHAPAPPRFPVIELRRTTTAPGRRHQFAQYFEAYLPEAFQQLGALAFGHFFERERADRFTWLHGFRDLTARTAVNQRFYEGPVWREHHPKLHGCIAAQDEVLLLRPLYRGSELPALAAVDPVAEPDGAQGIAVVQLFKVAAGGLDACAAAAETFFLGYTGPGVTEAAILATLAPPPAPEQAQGGAATHLVWIGMLRDEAALAALRPRFASAARQLAQAGLLDGEPELLVLDPGHRSRMRWMRGRAAWAARPATLGRRRQRAQVGQRHRRHLFAGRLRQRGVHVRRQQGLGLAAQGRHQHETGHAGVGQLQVGRAGQCVAHGQLQALAATGRRQHAVRLARQRLQGQGHGRRGQARRQHRLDQGRHHAGQRRAAGLAAGLFHRGRQLLQMPVQRRRQQGLLVRVILVQGADRDPGRLGHAGAGQPLAAMRQQLGNAGRENGLDGARRALLQRALAG